MQPPHAQLEVSCPQAHRQITWLAALARPPVNPMAPNSAPPGPLLLEDLERFSQCGIHTPWIACGFYTVNVCANLRERDILGPCNEALQS